MNTAVSKKLNSSKMDLRVLIRKEKAVFAADLLWCCQVFEVERFDYDSSFQVSVESLAFNNPFRQL